MRFELAMLLSLALHLTLFTWIQLVWLFRFRPRVAYRRGFKARLAFALAFWIGSIEVFDGCPFTHVENAVAEWVYGRPFYPDYSKRDTLIYHLWSGEQERSVPD